MRAAKSKHFVLLLPDYEKQTKALQQSIHAKYLPIALKSHAKLQFAIHNYITYMNTSMLLHVKRKLPLVNSEATPIICLNCDREPDKSDREGTFTD